MQRTLMLIKPDAVRRNLIGEVISRVEKAGLKISALEMSTLDDLTAHALYREHEGKGFFVELIDFIKSGPLVAMAVDGEEAIATVRELMGATDPAEAAQGTIRGDYGKVVTENLVHGSDSEDSAKRELRILFG